MKKECCNCKGYLFFKPFPDETFLACDFHGESVKDINLQTGVSPAIQKYKIEKVPCGKFKKGKSHCWPPPEKPFNVSPIRIAGENLLRQKHGV